MVHGSSFLKYNADAKNNNKDPNILTIQILVNLLPIKFHVLDVPINFAVSAKEVITNDAAATIPAPISCGLYVSYQGFAT